jgi:hypothetical protein
MNDKTEKGRKHGFSCSCGTLFRCSDSDERQHQQRDVVAQRRDRVSLLDILYSAQRRSSHSSAIENVRKTPFDMHPAFAQKFRLLTETSVKRAVEKSSNQLKMHDLARILGLSKTFRNTGASSCTWKTSSNGHWKSRIIGS